MSPEVPGPSAGLGTLVALLAVIGVSSYLGLLAQRTVRQGNFLQGYFLGNRGLGAWALALTATVQSGGTFMGFPSFVYSYGWVVALWIAAYMVVPISNFGLMGKRLAQLSRRTQAITVPDLFRERFGSPTVGLIASLLVLFFMAFMMIAQFKAGAIVMKLAWPNSGALALADDTTAGALDRGYYLGLTIFTVTVVGYTLAGGFLASVWTDLFQSVLMFLGVALLAVLVIPAAGGLSAANVAAVEHTGDSYLTGPGYSPDGREFVTTELAISFFFVWIVGGLGSPAGIVRIMACKNTGVIRRSMVLLSGYNLFIYLPLVAICVCGRALLPDLGEKSDEIIPRLALLTTEGRLGGSLMSGLILAAPFGAVMSTVSTYLVILASGLVRDVYQRLWNPDATWVELRRVTHLAMIGLGLAGFLANIYPVRFLQALVVFSSSGQAAAFAVPALMACYWRRATAPGIVAAMLAGSGTILGLFAAGWAATAQGYDPLVGAATAVRPWYLLGFESVVWGVTASLIAGVVVSLLTRPPDAALVSRLFDLPDAHGLEAGAITTSRAGVIS